MQFDPALEEFEGVIADSTLAKTHYFEWRDAVRWALVIAVRKNKDPERALRIVRQLLRQPSTSFDLREFAQAWEESLLEWKADLATQVRVVKLLSEARRLIGKANVIQRYPADHTGDVYLLRALGKIDDLLRSTTTEKAVSEALFLAGQASEVLAFPKIWPVHEVYYEACIRRSPHTDLAGECYHRYEAAIYYGYSGSGGVFIPDAIRELLSELRKLAQVAPQEEARP
jgi:hypothetical protein